MINDLVAAVYRLLSSAGLEHYSVGTFRRHWTGAKDWIKNCARPSTLVQMYELVGMSTQRLETMLGELSALEKHAAQPTEPYGEPVHVLRR